MGGCIKWRRPQEDHSFTAVMEPIDLTQPEVIDLTCSEDTVASSYDYHRSSHSCPTEEEGSEDILATESPITGEVVSDPTLFNYTLLNIYQNSVQRLQDDDDYFTSMSFLFLPPFPTREHHPYDVYQYVADPTPYPANPLYPFPLKRKLFCE